MPTTRDSQALTAALESLRIAAIHGDTSRFDQDDARVIAARLAALRDLLRQAYTQIERSTPRPGEHPRQISILDAIKTALED